MINVTKSLSENKKAKKLILTEEDIRKIDKFLLQEVKKYSLIILSAIITAVIINRLIAFF